MAKEPTREVPTALSQDSIVKMLSAAKSGDLPIVEAVEVEGGLDLKITYGTAEMHAARVSVDSDAIRTLPGVKVISAEQFDLLNHVAGPVLDKPEIARESTAAQPVVAHAGSICLFRLRRG